MNKPDQWVMLKIEHDKLKEPLYKIFASWIGGYLDGDYWRLNSGVVRMEEEEDFYNFYGSSGSCYQCQKNTYGTGTSFHTNVLDDILKKGNSVGSVEVLGEDTNWLELNYN